MESQASTRRIAEFRIVEVTYMTAVAAYFTEKNDAPSFGNYGFVSAVSFNLNRYLGVEGELGSMIATTSDLQFGRSQSPHEGAGHAELYGQRRGVTLGRTFGRALSVPVVWVRSRCSSGQVWAS